MTYRKIHTYLYEYTMHTKVIAYKEILTSKSALLKNTRLRDTSQLAILLYFNDF